jgi:hypothetical protein
MFYSSKLKKKKSKRIQGLSEKCVLIWRQISLTSHMYSVQVEINIAKEEKSSDKKSKFTFRISGF